MFYYDQYWRHWTRRLLRLSSCYIDISLTGEWPIVREERIRIHHTVDRGIVLCDRLPDEVRALMVQNLGEPLAERLIHHNYIRELGLKNIIKANLDWNSGGGVPALIVQTRRLIAS